MDTGTGVEKIKCSAIIFFKRHLTKVYENAIDVLNVIYFKVKADSLINSDLYIQIYHCFILFLSLLVNLGK